MPKKRNIYSGFRDYDVGKGTVKGFMGSHNKPQRLLMHSLLHSRSMANVPYKKRKALHDAIVRRDIKNHRSPL